ncbi:uncharacterized protein LOC131294172, partial [Anopheles ziemanni]
KSSSPGRQGPTGGSAGSGRGRYGKAVRGGGLSTLPRPVARRTAAASELRRSSAAGLNVVSQRPPLPPRIELRSHSYDGLLDDGGQGIRRKVVGTTMAVPSPMASMTTEGHDRVDGVASVAAPSEGEVSEQQKEQLRLGRKPSMSVVAGAGSGPGSAGGETIKSKNRRSRSMDDLFDDDVRGQAVECDFLDNTQSMETLLGNDHQSLRVMHEPAGSSPPESPGATEDAPPEVEEVRSMGGNICFNRRFVHDDEEPEGRQEDVPPVEDPQDFPSLTTSHEQLCENETITVDSTPRLAQEEEDVQSTHSSATASSHGSSSGPKKAPKPLINRYVKKVKSLMKM